MTSIKLGDKVIYCNYVLYCQPNGTSAYLYSKKEDIGFPHRRVFTPSLSSLKKAPDDALITNIDPESIQSKLTYNQFVIDDEIQYMQSRIDGLRKWTTHF